MFLGYVIWFYARIAIIHTSSDMMAEAASGTLEQMYMSPVPAEFLLLARLCALFVSTTLLVFVPSLGMILLLGIHFPLRFEGLFVFALTLSGLFGFTLFLTGAALIFKQIDALADLIQNLLLFLTGSFIPVTIFPHWLEYFARTLPTTQGSIVLRDVVLKGQSLLAAWSNGSLIWLTLNSALYLAGGWLVFKLCEHTARKQGSLGQY